MEYLNPEPPKDNVICRNCGSDSLWYSKHINWGPKAGTVYHYKIHCNGCQKSYHVERNWYVFEKVKEVPWNKSKSFIKMEQAQKLGLF